MFAFLLFVGQGDGRAVRETAYSAFFLYVLFVWLLWSVMPNRTKNCLHDGTVLVAVEKIDNSENYDVVVELAL